MGIKTDVVRIARSNSHLEQDGVRALRTYDHIRLIVPSILGAPLGWTNYNTTAVFTIKARDGTFIAKHVARDEQSHYIGIYYGYQNVSAPFEHDLASVLKSFSQFLLGRQNLLIETARSGVASTRAGPGEKALKPTKPPDEQAKEHLEAGIRALDAKDFARAELLFRKATALVPDKPAPHFYLGKALVLQGRCDEGTLELRRYLGKTKKGRLAKEARKLLQRCSN